MPSPPPLDCILADAGSARAGTFACQVDNPRFADTGPIEHFLVYFPRCGVWIRHEGAAPFVADLQLATIYNRGQRYTRRAIGKSGDHGDWFAVREDVAREIARSVDQAAADAEAPFRFSSAPVESDLFLRQRVFSRQLRRGDLDPLAVEEGIIALVAAVIGSAYRARRAGAMPARRLTRHHALAARAKEALLDSAERNTSVTQLARTLDTSPFHLCRVFRAVTGLSLHQYRVEHRLRASVDRVAACGSLSTLAADLGFASHSHYTRVFRRHWRTTPSGMQRRLAGESEGLPHRAIPCHDAR